MLAYIELFVFKLDLSEMEMWGIVYWKEVQNWITTTDVIKDTGYKGEQHILKHHYSQDILAANQFVGINSKVL